MEMKNIAFYDEKGNLVRMQVKNQATDAQAISIVAAGLFVIGFILL